MVKQARRAFTLVEILIVVIILGILAAIVVPQFTSASEDAQISNVESQLQTIRNQIELFRVRNNGQYPDFANYAPATPWGDPAVNPGSNLPADRMARGLRGDDYLRSDPVNPRTNASDILIGAATAAGDVNGWWWDPPVPGGGGVMRAARLSEAGIDPGVTETVWLD